MTKYNSCPCNPVVVEEAKFRKKPAFFTKVFNSILSAILVIASRNRLYRLAAAICDPGGYKDAQTAFKDNTNGCARPFVEKNCYFFPNKDSKCSCHHQFLNGLIPFKALRSKEDRGNLCSSCICEGRNLLKTIASSNDKIYIRCAHLARTYGKKRCLAHVLGYVAIQNCDADHIVPIAAGGIHDVSNMQFICSTCNRTKGRWFSSFDTFEISLFHPRYRDEMKKYLESVGFNTQGSLRLTQEQLDDLSKEARKCVERFFESKEYHSVVFEYIKNYHPGVYKKDLKPLVDSLQE